MTKHSRFPAAVQGLISCPHPAVAVTLHRWLPSTTFLTPMIGPTAQAVSWYSCKKMLLIERIGQERQNWISPVNRHPKVQRFTLHKSHGKKRKVRLTAGLELWSCTGSSGRCCTRAGPGWRAAPSMDSTTLQAKGRTAQGKQDRRGGQTEKGTRVKQKQSSGAPTFVIKLRSREKGDKEEHLATGKGKTAHKSHRVFWNDSKLLTGSL